MNQQYLDNRTYELDRREEMRARRERFAPPASHCSWCGSPPEGEFGCPTCGRPEDIPERPAITPEALATARAAAREMARLMGECKWHKVVSGASRIAEHRRRYREHERTVEMFEHVHAVRLRDVLSA